MKLFCFMLSSFTLLISQSGNMNNNIVHAIDNSPPPNDRWLSVIDKCNKNDDLNASIDNHHKSSFVVPCFSCYNIRREMGEQQSPPPPPPPHPSHNISNIFDPSDDEPEMIPGLFNKSFHKIIKPKSIYVHCFIDANNTNGNNGSIYNIYYNELNCKGNPIIDDVLTSECPDCSGCNSSPKECLINYECDNRCCAPVIECSDCNNQVDCDTKRHCESCPSCTNTNLHQPAIEDDDQHSKNDSKPVYIPSKGSYFKDIGNKFVVANVFVGENCSANHSNAFPIDGNYNNSLINSKLLPSFNCTPVSPNADNVTFALSIGCFKDINGFILSNAIGYKSLSDCEARLNPTFNFTGPDGHCFVTPSRRWSVNTKCNGWGMQPYPKPKPRTPKEGEIGVIVRKQYPDRRCQDDQLQQQEQAPPPQQLYRYHQKNLKSNIQQCGVCIAEPNKIFHKIDCLSMKNFIYNKPNCTGDHKVEEMKNCKGDVIRGVINDELDAGLKEDFSFITGYNGDKCFAEVVSFNAGIRSGICSTIKMFDNRLQNIKVDCNTRTLTTYNDEECLNKNMSRIFVDHECSPGNQPQQGGINQDQNKPMGMLSISCSGYKMALTMPPLTNKPTFKPTNIGETREPTKSPTAKTCPDIARGCSSYNTNTCSGKSASWTLSNKKYQCSCSLTDKSSKVNFKLKISSFTVQDLTNDKCMLNGMFQGIHSKVYQKAQASIINDFPVEADGSPVQQGSDVIISFRILGFIDSKVADEVVSYITSNSNEITTAIQQMLAGPPPNGDSNAATPSPGTNNSLAISFVDGSISRVDNIQFCGCSESADGVASDSLSKFMSGNYLVEAILAGISTASFAASSF